MSINRKLFPSICTSTRSVEGSRLYANPSQIELNSCWLNKNLANSNRNEQKLMYKRTHKIQILFFSHGFPWRYNVQRIENILKCLKTTNLRTTCLYINPFLTRVTSRTSKKLLHDFFSKIASHVFFCTLYGIILCYWFV